MHHSSLKPLSCFSDKMKHLPYFDRVKNDHWGFYISLIKLDWPSFMFSTSMFSAHQTEPFLYLSSITLFEQGVFLDLRFGLRKMTIPVTPCIRSCCATGHPRPSGSMQRTFSSSSQVFGSASQGWAWLQAVGRVPFCYMSPIPLWAVATWGLLFSWEKAGAWRGKSPLCRRTSSLFMPHRPISHWPKQARRPGLRSRMKEFYFVSYEVMARVWIYYTAIGE